jgi:transcription antitermination factor NusG
MPGYVFVELETPRQRDYVQSCYYLSGLLGEWSERGFLPRQIPTGYVVDLIEHGPWEVNKMKSRFAFKKGDRVKLSLGRLAGIIAEVEGIDNPSKIVVRADLLGGVRLIHVEPERLEAAETDSDTAELDRPSVMLRG